LPNDEENRGDEEGNVIKEERGGGTERKGDWMKKTKKRQAL
jgi:hypothetical protein